MLSQQNRAKLIIALAAYRDIAGFITEEAEQLLKWAESIIVQSTLLDLIIKGDVLVDVLNIDPVSSDNVVFIDAKTQLKDRFEEYLVKLKQIDKLIKD